MAHILLLSSYPAFLSGLLNKRLIGQGNRTFIGQEDGREKTNDNYGDFKNAGSQRKNACPMGEVWQDTQAQARLARVARVRRFGFKRN